MTARILSEITASISELKANPMSIIAGAGEEPVAILNHNKPAFYCISPALYESMMDALDDLALAGIVRQREGQREIELHPDDL